MSPASPSPSLEVPGAARDATPWAHELGISPTPDLAHIQIADQILAMVPRAFAVRHRLLPLRREGARLIVAVADPLATEGPDALGHLLRLPIEPVLAASAELSAALGRFYGPVAQSVETLIERTLAVASGPEVVGDGRFETSVESVGEQPGSESDESVIRRVRQIILDATQRRASDIHLEPLEKRLRVRYRIDAVLHEVESQPKRLQLAIVSRLKIMANISIAEKRVPQDGRIRFGMEGRQLDLRVSSLPTAHGESLVMRLLEKEGLRPGLPELGLRDDDAAMMRKLITLPDGMILVTGPTGSGKTTTLYSCLHAINQRERKIITVEDPVEYQLSGINQVPVRPEVGMTFASALRTMLRQAPNVVMVGEIRDYDTAEIAIHASLTGHLVFSTLHTNDAPSAVARLLDLGVKPFLVSTSLRASVAQRLVRKICPGCSRPWMPDRSELEALGLGRAEVAAARFARGAGCPQCHQTGYRGRTGIFEIFSVDGEIERMIHERVSTAQLRERSRRRGMSTMRKDGMRKATTGLTTIEEVASITAGDTS